MNVGLIVVVPDTQVPYEHKRGVAALATFIKKRKPDTVLHVGDLCDFPSLSRWHRGQRGEYDVSLGAQRDRAVGVLRDLGVDHLSRSNHDDRAELYVASQAPALEGLDELRLENFLRLNELGVRLHRKPFSFLPGWHLMHGDEGGLSSEPGKTALGLARKVGTSVVCGHTHRLGLQPFTESVGGTVVRVRYGFEVGCLMDMRKANYIMEKGGFANWQLGFGAIYYDRDNRKLSTPVPVPMNQDGSFLFEGKYWS